MKKVLLILGMLATALAACSRIDPAPAAASAAPAVSTEDPVTAAHGHVTVYKGTAVFRQADVTRFIDADAGVLCYKTYEGGISCLPLSQTDLNGKGEAGPANPNS